MDSMKGKREMKGRDFIHLPEQVELIFEDGVADVKEYRSNAQTEISNPTEKK